MKYTDGMGSAALYTHTKFHKTGSGFQNSIEGDTQTHRLAGDRINVL
jgi:hypothetical protein